MTKARLVLLVFMVTIAAGATIALAWFAAGEVLPVWQAVLGPILLVTMLFVRWRTAKMQAEAAKARQGMTPGE